MDNILHLDGNEWLTCREMADELDVSERTVGRMLDRGELEGRDNPNGAGKLYRRPVDEGAPGRQSAERGGVDVPPEGDREESERKDGPEDGRVDRLLARLEARNDRIAELEARAGKLEAGLETAADYVEDLEARLDRERERAERLRERLDRVRDERDDARRERDRAHHEIDDLSSAVDRLKADRDRRTVLLKVGAFEISMKS